jgi:Flp pilus assembly pilin Flp
MARGTGNGVVPRPSFQIATMSPRTSVARLLRDESGQDVIEYVLLTAGIGIVTIATWPVIETAIRVSYQALDTNTQNLWVPPDPAGGGS